MDSDIKKVLVTGSAGFIGFHLAKKLLDNGISVIGIDNINSYYDPTLKEARLAQLTPYATYDHVTTDLADRQGMADLFSQNSFDGVVNLAAQAGVRYSLENPHSYVDTKYCRLCEPAGGLPSLTGQTFCVCLVQFGVRCQYEDAFFSAS